MSIPVLLVAEDLAAYLGSPTVAALSARWSASAPCEICGRELESSRVSIIARSTAGRTEHIYLRPAHEDCSASVWVKDADEAELANQPVRAELIVILLSSLGEWAPAGGLGSITASIHDPLVVLAVNPSVSAAHYLVMRPGEAVDLDMIELSRSGWRVLAETALREARSALRVSTLDSGFISVTVPDAVTWQVPASAELERAVRLRGGLLVGVGHRPSVAEISAAGPDAAEIIMPALEYGDFLSAWASLR